MLSFGTAHVHTVEHNICFVNFCVRTNQSWCQQVCMLIGSKKKKMEILDTWVFLAQTNSSVRLRSSLGGLIWQPGMQLSGVTVRVYCVPRREMSCVVWGGKEPPLWCHPLWCHAQGQTNVFSENLRQGSVNMRSHFSYGVRTQLAHLSLCCAWAVFQVRDENENAPFVWNWSHCYLYETPFFSDPSAKKKGAWTFPLRSPRWSMPDPE